MNILDGKALSEEIYSQLKEKTNSMKQKPCLAVILIGEDPASHVYVKNKEKACNKAGVESRSIRLPENVSEAEVLQEIEKLNADKTVTGMIVQVPLPAHISEEKVLYTINPKKDMDGFHPSNLGEMYLSKEKEFLPPATPAGIITLLEKNNIEIAGKNVVVLGRSNNVGKAVAIMLLNRNATVIICHSKTKNLEAHVQKADIIIAAVGIAHFVKPEMVQEGAVIVDVGIHRTENGLTGDVAPSALQKASLYSPVPGGVGPMTVASLIANTVRSTQ